MSLVLGPILFNIYLLPIFEIFNKYPDINFYSFAYDLQMYLNYTDSPHSVLVEYKTVFLIYSNGFIVIL